uniref:Uncharacterized protein n=1 Tax=Setaria italica TaxID=4555 RepID=K4A4A8_SETIT
MGFTWTTRHGAGSATPLQVALAIPLGSWRVPATTNTPRSTPPPCISLSFFCYR